jgi:hypothetical protein
MTYLCRHRGEADAKLQIVRNFGARRGLSGQHHVPAAEPQGTPGTHCTGGELDLGAGLDGHAKLRRHRDSIPGFVTAHIPAF